MHSALQPLAHLPCFLACSFGFLSSPEKMAGDKHPDDPDHEPNCTLALGQFCRLRWGGRGEKGIDAPHVILEWASDPVNDMIADSVISIIMQLEEEEQQQQQQQREQAVSWTVGTGCCSKRSSSRLGS